MWTGWEWKGQCVWVNEEMKELLKQPRGVIILFSHLFVFEMSLHEKLESRTKISLGICVFQAQV